MQQAGSSGQPGMDAHSSSSVHDSCSSLPTSEYVYVYGMSWQSRVLLELGTENLGLDSGRVSQKVEALLVCPSCCAHPSEHVDYITQETW